MTKQRLSSIRILALFAAFALLPLSANADDIEDFFRAVAIDNARDVKWSIDHGFNPNVREKYRGDTGLMVAVQEGSMHVFDVLVNAPNIDLEAIANNGDNALMLAAYKGNREAVDTLLKRGVKINRSKWTALHYAAAGGKNDIVQTLLDRGANINARSPNSTTPLMIAAYEGYFETVQLLLEHGADVTLKNENGMNAADYAKRFNRQDIIDLVNDYLKKAEQERLEIGQEIGFAALNVKR